MNEKAFQRARSRASNDRSLVDRKSLFTELERFKVFPILIEFDRIRGERLKILFSFHDDISGTGSRIGINKKAFQRGKFNASYDLSSIDRGLLSSKL